VSLILQFYPWIKALHLISVIAWMAGLLYLPRIFVYHAGVPIGSDQDLTFQTMERKLMRVIMMPAMAATILLGGLLVAVIGMAGQGWLHAKLLLVVLLIVLHVMMGRWRRDFAAGRNTRSPRFFRFMNEAPTILMIAIVILAVVKPF
jgi:putative membrane protein